jgi:hypothetical protein
MQVYNHYQQEDAWKWQAKSKYGNEGQPLIEVSLMADKINKLTVNNKPTAIKLDSDKLLLINVQE